MKTEKIYYLLTQNLKPHGKGGDNAWCLDISEHKKEVKEALDKLPVYKKKSIQPPYGSTSYCLYLCNGMYYFTSPIITRSVVLINYNVRVYEQ